jgi:hypothetical protein
LGGIGDTFPIITVLYLFAGAYTVYQLATNWRSFWSGTPTSANEQLAGSVAFFLLIPIAVLLHEFGHMLAAWSTGSQVLGLHYFIYWGYVEIIPSSNSPLLDWYIALSGNFVSYLLGIAALAAALLWKMKPNLRIVVYQFGVLGLLQTLIFYPIISLVDPLFHGDWDSIYSFQAPIASTVTLTVHAISLAALFYIMRARRTPRRVRRKLSPPPQN